MSESVDSRHLLLIGAGPGVGASVVRRFGREGFRSTLISRGETLEQLAPALRSDGLEIEAVGTDIEDLDGYRATLERIFRAAGAPGSPCTTLPCRILARSSTRRSGGSGPHLTSMSSAP
jgi:NAD(P)-dependent dehydrogenase (short-subunit alcohol dehydrogenase family)